MSESNMQNTHSPYTPTTEEVRDVYKSRLIKVGDNRFELIDEIQADLEFDRWLAEVKADGWQEGMTSVKKHVSCWPKQNKLPVNPYRPRNGNNDTEIPETGKPTI